MSSLLLHVDFLHLDCWVREINFAHKLLALYGTTAFIWFVLFTRFKRSSMVSNAKKKAFFLEMSEWDSMRSLKNTVGKGRSGGGRGTVMAVEELDDIEEKEGGGRESEEDSEDSESGGEVKENNTAFEDDFYSKHGNVAQATIG